MILIKFLLAIAIGATFRILWSKHFMNKTLYYVNPLLVTLVMALSMIADPKSGAFVVGVFIFDLIYFLIKDNERSVEKYKKFLNKLMSKPTVENVDENQSKA